MKFVWRVTVLLLVSGVAAPGEQPASPAQLTGSEQLAAQMLGRRGELIYLHDRAAWLATDEVQRLKGFNNDKRLRGYVTEHLGSETRVTFFGHADGESEKALYRVTIPDDGRPAGPAQALSEPGALSEYEAGAVRARDLAMRQSFAACSRTYNTVVLPVSVSGEEQWVVYLLPGATERDVIPMGGAYRMEINQAANAVLSQRSFSKSCIQMKNEPKAEALVITHLLDPMPTELHVFWSLSARKPLYVIMTENKSFWVVEGATISLAERELKDEDPAASK